MTASAAPAPARPSSTLSYGLRCIEYVVDEFKDRRAELLVERLGAAIESSWVDETAEGRRVFLFALSRDALRNTEAHGIASRLGYITNTESTPNRCGCSASCEAPYLWH